MSRSTGHALLLLMAAALLLSPLPAAAQDGGNAARGDRVVTVTETLVGGVGGVAVDGSGDIYSADFGETVYKITPDGRVRVFATGVYGASGNTIDARGRLIQSSFVGNYLSRFDRHGNEEIIAEGLQGPVGVVGSPEGEFFVCNCRGNSIARVSAAGEVTTLAQGGLFSCPNGITFGPDGHLYVVNFSDGRMLQVTLDGEASEFATIPGPGNGHVAFARPQRGQRGGCLLHADDLHIDARSLEVTEAGGELQHRVRQKRHIGLRHDDAERLGGSRQGHRQDDHDCCQPTHQRTPSCCAARHRVSRRSAMFKARVTAKPMAASTTTTAK